MRHNNLFKSFRSKTERRNTPLFTDSKGFRAVVILSLVAVAVITLAVIRQTVTAQAQKPTEVSEAASLFEANAATNGQTTRVETRQQPDIKTNSEDNASLIPEGSVCGWSSSTVFPVTILDQATVTVGSNLYSFGGVSTSILANAYKFDGTTWTPIAPLPQPLEFPTAVTDGTNIYILGGASTAGTPQTTLYKYDVAMNSYTTLAPFTVGTWNAAAVFLGGKIYKFAGTGPATASTDALEIYDVAGNTWTSGTAYPLQISFVSAFKQGSFIYAAGGIQSVGSLASLKTYRYDPVGNTWDDVAIADLPLTRWGAASSNVGYGVNNGWVLAGGYENGTATANISTTAIRWNPMTNTWSSLPAMIGERARMTGAILGSNFYVIGGRSVASSGFVGTNSNQKLLCFSGVAVITSGAATITAESFPPPNNAPDPGETVTVSLPLQNEGDTATTNLTATLQATGGVTSPSAPQNYGVLPPMGAATSKTFTFTVDPSTICGSTITLTWLINDGATNYPNVVKTFTVGTPVLVSENFDGVTAPNLPAGWTTTQDVGTAITWATTATGPSSAPNSAFANDPATVNMSSLVSPNYAVSSTTSRLSFKNKYITESTFDGMVLEMKIGAGAFQDILAAGGSFVSGGYNGAISTAFMSPIAGRMAWTGTSAGGYVDTVVNLPAAANGQMVQFRWRMASDSSVAATGVNVDDVQVLNGYVCTAAPSASARADFDGDGKTDLSVFRPSEGNWYLNRSTAGFQVLQWGTMSDQLVPGDFDGDGKADTAVFRPDANPTNPDFYVLNSNGFVFSGVSWGVPGDIPLTGTYDADVKADFAVFRPSNSTWYILNSSNGSNTVEPFGLTGDIPLAIDNDGDGRTNLAVFRPSENTWYIAKPTGVPATNFDAIQYGLPGDLLVPADYTGDGKEDVAVFRPSTGTWYIRNSVGGATTIKSFGAMGDIPVPGDYDGDGTDDIAVYRNGTWFVQRSTAGLLFQNFGLATDIPIPVKYLPGTGGGGGGAATVSYTGPVVAIPDNLPAGVNINLPVTGVGTVSDLNFRFDEGGACNATVGNVNAAVDHTFIGDLTFKLTPPDGAPTVTFQLRRGGTRENICLTNINDEGGFPSLSTLTSTSGMFEGGNFSPDAALSQLDGENADGTWVLNVSDNANIDTGNLRRFSLIFNSGN